MFLAKKTFVSVAIKVTNQVTKKAQRSGSKQGQKRLTPLN